jgi:hypothetical protein
MEISKTLKDVGDKMEIGDCTSGTIIGIFSSVKYDNIVKRIRKEKCKDYSVEKSTVGYRLCIYGRHIDGFTPPIYDDHYFEAMGELAKNPDY